MRSSGRHRKGREVLRCALAGLLCWMVLPWDAGAQPPLPAYQKFHHARLAPAGTDLQIDTSRVIDVVHYNLDLVLPLTAWSLRGRNVITLELLSPADHVTLNAAKLTLDSVHVDGIRCPFTTDTTLEVFTVALGRMRPAHDTLELSIVYHFDSSFYRATFRRGYYFFDVDLGLPSPLGYTMSEPSETRFWMPCNDDPRDKATAEVRATVPTGFVAASNGALVDVVENGDGTTSWHWRETHRLAPYLICVTASRYVIPAVQYVRAAGDTIPLQYYVWPEDSLECAEYLPTVRTMVAALSAVFGPYPFDKYGMTAVIPFGYAGMEHQSLTTLNRYYKTDERVVVHELAHQWWGDLVTCATWPDIWLNESFATYAEALWGESQGGATGLHATMQSLEHFWYGSWLGAVYDPEGQGYNLFDDLVYSKGAWVLHTLRGVVGDSAFFATLHAYRSAFAEGNATTEDFKAVAESVVGTDLSWFFNQWIYGEGWPVYQLHLNGSSQPFRFTITQVQQLSWPVFRMPIPVRLYHQESDTTIVVWDTLRTQSFAVDLPWVPDSARLDPDGWVLKQVTATTAVAVRDHAYPETFALEQNYPNPFNPKTVVSFQLPVASEVRLGVYDLLGREVRVLVNGKKDAGRYGVDFDAAGLASGVYLYRLTAGPFMATKKLVLLH